MSSGYSEELIVVVQTVYNEVKWYNQQLLVWILYHHINWIAKSVCEAL